MSTASPLQPPTFTLFIPCNHPHRRPSYQSFEARGFSDFDDFARPLQVSHSRRRHEHHHHHHHLHRHSRHCHHNLHRSSLSLSPAYRTALRRTQLQRRRPGAAARLQPALKQLGLEAAGGSVRAAACTCVILMMTSVGRCS